MSDFDKKIVEKKIKEMLEGALRTKNMRELGNETVRQVQGRIRTGKGVRDNNESEERFQPLADSTKKAKRRNKSKLGRFASPNRSNLNDTGEMVDSIHADPKKDGFTIDVAEDQETKAKAHHKGGPNLPKRPFLFLSKRELKRLVVAFQELLESYIR